MRSSYAVALLISLSTASCGDDEANVGGSGGGAATGSGGSLATGNGGDGSGGSPDNTSNSSTGAGAGLPGGPSSDRLTLRPIGSVEGAPQGYAEYLPPGYGNGVPKPLLLFHHGIGESGDGSEAQLDILFNTGLPTLIENDSWPEERPFIVLMTQHDAPPGTSCHSADEIAAFIDFAMGHYEVDPKRVYLTGLSCGAIGSWNYLGAHTDEIVAGAVLIAGNGNPAFGQAGCALGRVPIWAFHGDMDSVVDESGSVGPITSLQACTDPAPVDAQLTLYPGVDHNSWDQTYNLSAGHDIYAWLLGHQHP